MIIKKIKKNWIKFILAREKIKELQLQRKAFFLQERMIKEKSEIPPPPPPPRPDQSKSI